MKHFLNFASLSGFVDGLFTSYCNLNPSQNQIKTFKSVFDYLTTTYLSLTPSEFYVVFTPYYCCIFDSESSVNSLKLIDLDFLIFKVSFTPTSIYLNFI